MARIQRVPRGLNDVLSLAGGQTPQELIETVQPVFELLQAYALSQNEVRAVTDPAQPEGGTLGFIISPRFWSVLFSAEFTVTGTGTMTALSTIITLQRRTLQPVAIASKEFNSFGATVTGFKRITAQMPYPLLCPPGTAIFGGIDILGTDATAVGNFAAEFGILG